jgi:hypothetical protein
MDIRPDEPQRGVQLYPLRSKIIIVVSLILALTFLLLTDLQIGFVGFSLVLCAVGVTTIDSWNRELREDGYAPLTQLYTSYLTAVFLLVAIFPSVAAYIGFQIAIPLCLIASIIYGGILQYIAYRGVEDYETAIEAYGGPSVIYLKNGSYISHVEKYAERKRFSSDEEDNQKEEENKEEGVIEE